MDSNQKSKLPIGPEEYIITEQKPPETRANTSLGGSDQRAAFEAWISSPPRNHKISRSGERAMYPGRYEYYEAQIAWEAWQAALASTEVQALRKDAERYRYRCVMRRDHTIRRVFTHNGPELDAAIDHARRIEGEGE